MKLQGMAILYVIIIIPMLIVISLTLSGYKGQLGNTLKYDSELTGAVNDAITAFELNSASQNYSNVSDVFTSLVDASVNVFSRSIATRLNMTNADETLMNRYFPLALFTGYSGYYIYSPTYSPVVVKNPYTGQAAFSSDTTTQTPIDKDSATYKPSNKTTSLQYTPILLKHKDHDNASGSDILVTTSKDFSNNVLAKQEIDYSLKQMIPYTLELDYDTDNKILLNFTLDNYISFTGKIKGIAYNKSGYLLNNDTSIELRQGSNVLYNMTKLDNDLIINHLTYFDEYVDDYIETELTKGNALVTLTIKDGDNSPVSIVLNPTEYRAGYNRYVSDKKEQMTGQFAYQKQQLDAIKYYIKAANFSNFVYKNLNIYTEDNIKEINLYDEDVKYEKYFLKYDKNNKDKLFPTDQRILDDNSTFNEVKRKAIRNSVQYDLIISTLNYNYLVSSSDFILSLPVITDKDWDRIVENISFTAFLQGLSVGSGKTYSNYAISTSTMNEFVINPDTIYFSDIQGFNQGHIESLESSELYFHKINCPDFIEHLVGKEIAGNDISTGAIGFKMNEWVYDARWSREESRYIYDHKNYSHFKCIANSTIKKRLSANEEKIINKNLLSALAAEKERSFKTNKILDGGGYKSFESSVTNQAFNIKTIKGFELATTSTNRDEKEFIVSVKAGSESLNFIMSRQVNSVLAYPSESSGLKDGKYVKHRDFINRMRNSFGNDAKWSHINNVTFNVRNTRTTDLEPIVYIKIVYI